MLNTLDSSGDGKLSMDEFVLFIDVSCIRRHKKHPQPYVSVQVCHTINAKKCGTVRQFEDPIFEKITREQLTKKKIAERRGGENHHNKLKNDPKIVGLFK